jgi:hypothetical protein
MELYEMIINCTRELEATKGDRKKAAYRKLLAAFASKLKKLEVARRKRGIESTPLDPEIEREYEEVLGERLREDASARTNFAHIMAFVAQEQAEQAE